MAQMQVIYQAACTENILGTPSMNVITSLFPSMLNIFRRKQLRKGTAQKKNFFIKDFFS